MASASARIHCGRCKRKWNVLWRDARNENANVCPYCGEAIDRQLWDKEVVKALAVVQDANIELEKDSSGYRKPRFRVDFYAD